MCEHDRIRQTLAHYTQYIDDRRFDDLADLFAEDATWTVAGLTFHGRRAIREHMSTWPDPQVRTVHLTFDSVIDVGGPTATVVSNYVLLMETDIGGVVARAGRFRDVLRDDGDRWRFTQRTNDGSSWMQAT